MIVNYNGCHGCGGKGWVAPTGVYAVICPVCAGTGVAKIKPETKPTTPMDSPFVYTADKCPIAASGMCFCTGACRGEKQGVRGTTHTNRVR